MRPCRTSSRRREARQAFSSELRIHRQPIIRVIIMTIQTDEHNADLSAAHLKHTPERQDCHTHSHSGSAAGNQNPYRLPPCDPYECTLTEEGGEVYIYHHYY